MSDLREAAQQALEALELAQTDVHWELNSPTRKFLRKAEKNLRAALAQPEQEPVAWMCPDDPERETAFSWKAGHCDNCGKQRIPLYTAPPQRKPLTEEEIVEAVREADLDWQAGWTLDERAPNRFATLARAVERAHGITE